jgi:hypothetical protein
MPGDVVDIIIPPSGVTDVVAPSGMQIGIFDWSPFLGIPLHLFVTVFFVLVFISVIIYWVVRLNKLASVNGWIESAKKMTPDDIQVWIITRVQRLFIECMTNRDNVLSSHDPLNIAMWHVSSPMGIVRIGGQTAVIVSEDSDKNRDIITEITLCENLDFFNDNQEWLIEQADKKYQEMLDKAESDEERSRIKKPNIIKPIEGFASYEHHGKTCLRTINPNGLKIRPYNIWNNNRFRKYFPKGNSATLFGGELILNARDWNIDKKEKSFWEVHAFLIMAAGIGLICVMAAWLIPLGA